MSVHSMSVQRSSSLYCNSTSTGTCDSFRVVDHHVELQMDNLMLKTRENTEFDRWWKDWISKRTQNPVSVEPRPSGKNLGSDVEGTAHAWPAISLSNQPQLG